MTGLSSVEKKMDMSLDDIIKASNKRATKPAAKPKGAAGAQGAARGKQGTPVRKPGARTVAVKKAPILIAKPTGVTKRSAGVPKALNTSLAKARVAAAKTTVKRTGTAKQSMAQKIMSRARGVKQAPKVLAGAKRPAAAPKQAPKLLPKAQQQQTRQQRQPIQFNNRQQPQQQAAAKSMAQTMNNRRKARVGVPVRQRGGTQSPAVRMRAPLQGGRAPAQQAQVSGRRGQVVQNSPQQLVRRTQQGRVRKPVQQQQRAPIMPGRPLQQQQQRQHFNNNNNFNNNNYNGNGFNSRAPVNNMRNAAPRGMGRRGGAPPVHMAPRQSAPAPRNTQVQRQYAQQQPQYVQQQRYANPPPARRVPHTLAGLASDDFHMVDDDDLSTLAKRQQVHALKVIELQKLEDAMNKAERKQHIYKLHQSVQGGSVKQAHAMTASRGPPPSSAAAYVDDARYGHAAPARGGASGSGHRNGGGGGGYSNQRYEDDGYGDY